MQKNLRLVKESRLPRVDIVVASVRKVRLSLSEQREYMELSKGLKLLIFGVEAQKESILAKIEVLAGNKRDREEEQF